MLPVASGLGSRPFWSAHPSSRLLPTLSLAAHSALSHVLPAGIFYAVSCYQVFARAVPPPHLACLPLLIQWHLSPGTTPD